ncbi:MAG TPA: 1,4-dihydroxy-2-naphthoate octaprenyltransferase, partial [Lentimicrobium sp.]|nr:1,4-dihydroxy-2-naphthoate octaprenyltransferase [Lentimicrobium sp.]
MTKEKYKAWVHAARPRTLPLAFSSSLMGSFVAWHDGIFSWTVFSLALLTTLFLQILSNLANDYGDSVNGADNPERV